MIKMEANKLTKMCPNLSQNLLKTYKKIKKNNKAKEIQMMLNRLKDNKQIQKSKRSKSNNVKNKLKINIKVAFKRRRNNVWKLKIINSKRSQLKTSRNRRKNRSQMMRNQNNKIHPQFINKRDKINLNKSNKWQMNKKKKMRQRNHKIIYAKS